MLAKKRVFDCTVVASSDFDELSFMAQALYMRLIADTDDIGVAEAGAVIRNTSRMRMKALDELVDGGFVTIIRDKGKIVYINGFHDNNFFSRYGARKSRYMTELLHNDYTKNVINKLKIRDDGNHMIGDDGISKDGTGDARICNADRFRQVASQNKHIGDYPMLFASLIGWYQYTDERGFTGITDKSINVLMEGCIKRCQEVDAYSVCDYIDNAVASGYPTINWSWFDDRH